MLLKTLPSLVVNNYAANSDETLKESANIYCPQRSWGKVMFSQVCVILFTGGVCMVAGGHAWLLGGMRGCWWGHAWQRGACMEKGGHAWQRGGMCGIRRDTEV